MLHAIHVNKSTGGSAHRAEYAPMAPRKRRSDRQRTSSRRVFGRPFPYPTRSACPVAESMELGVFAEWKCGMAGVGWSASICPYWKVDYRYGSRGKGRILCASQCGRSARASVSRVRSTCRVQSTNMFVGGGLGLVSALPAQTSW